MTVQSSTTNRYNSTHVGALDLPQLLAPISTAAFFERYWERRPLFVRRRNLKYYRSLHDLSDLDHIIASVPFHDERSLLLVKHENGIASTLPAPLVDGGAPNLGAVYTAFANGFTVVVRRIHLRREVVGDATAALEYSLFHRAGANLYVTPPRAQGFPTHIDDHEVFVLQLSGKKQWRLYASPFELPLHQLTNYNWGRPIQQLTLRPGDLLYLPTGVPHDAEASNHTSAHLTIGIHVKRWKSIVEKVIGLIAANDLALRRAVSPFVLRNLNTMSRETANVADRVRAAITPERVQQALSESVNEFLTSSHRLARGHLQDVGCVQQITRHSCFIRQSGAAPRVTTSGRSVTIWFRGGMHSVPSDLTPLLKFIADRERFLVSDIPRMKLRSEAVASVLNDLVTAGLLMCDSRHQADKRK
jgi:hypothetical protein